MFRDPLTTIVPSLGYDTYGLDITFVPIKYPNLTFMQSDVKKTDFQDNFFDTVVAVSTIEHVGMHERDLKGDRKAIKEIIRILKPGGILLMTVPMGNKFKETTFERIYDPESLKSLIHGLETSKIIFYKKEKSGAYVETEIKDLPEPEADASIGLISVKKIV